MYSSKVHLLCFSLTSYLRLACVLLPSPFLLPCFSLATTFLRPSNDLATIEQKIPRKHPFARDFVYPDPNYKYYILLFHKPFVNPLFIGVSKFAKTMQR